MTTLARTSITPGQPWLDTEGKRIQAHGGSMLELDGVFFWYGENKEHTVPGSDVWHWGVRCYSSTDLYNWTDLGVIIPPVLDDESSPLHPSQGMDRPHIIRNPRTGRFLCWIKVMRPGSQTTSVLEADSLLGPWTIVTKDMRPLGMNAGDFDLVVDPTDGKGYYYFERVHSELICADLNDDFTGVSGYYSTHFPRLQPPFVRESPAHFYRNGIHYLVTSGTTWYYPNPSEIATSLSYHGPWTLQGDAHPDDPSRTSFHSQISCVFRHPHKHDLYIAMGDRWLPGYLDDSSAALEMHERAFSPGRNDPEGEYAPLAEENTSLADYVWLPIRFDGAVARIDWRDEWTVEEFD